MLDDFTTDKSKEYDRWHSSVHGHEDPNKIQLCSWHLDSLSLFSSINGLKVLEIGCGVGDFAIHLTQLGAMVTAVDFSSAAIEIAKNKATTQGYNINFQVADAQMLSFDNESFDVIYSCECLEHIPDPQKALSEMNRVLKPKGRLILTTENYSNGMLIGWLKCWLFREPFNSGAGVQAIEHFFLFWNVANMFRENKLNILRMIGSHHVFLLLPRMHPHTFVVEKFKNTFLAKLFKPFARHVSFEAIKLPNEPTH